MDDLKNTDYETVVLTKEQALIYYGVESSKPFQINARLANVGDMLRHARSTERLVWNYWAIKSISTQNLYDK